MSVNIVVINADDTESAIAVLNIVMSDPQKLNAMYQNEFGDVDEETSTPKPEKVSKKFSTPEPALVGPSDPVPETPVIVHRNVKKIEYNKTKFADPIDMMAYMPKDQVHVLQHEKLGLRERPVHMSDIPSFINGDVNAKEYSDVPLAKHDFVINMIRMIISNGYIAKENDIIDELFEGITSVTRTQMVKKIFNSLARARLRTAHLRDETGKKPMFIHRFREKGTAYIFVSPILAYYYQARFANTTTL